MRQPKPVVLAVVAMPPPMNGQSAAAEMLVGGLRARGVHLRILDMSRSMRSMKAWERPLSGLLRALQVSLLACRVFLVAKRVPVRHSVFYIQTGQSTIAILRDGLLLSAAKAVGFPTIAHIHGGGLGRWYDSRGRAHRALGRGVYKRVDVVVVLSESLREMVSNIAPEACVEVIRNGVHSRFAALAMKEASGRTFPDNRRPFTVLFFSNLVDSKGHPVVLEAARLAQERGIDNLHFVIAGRETRDTVVSPHEFVAHHRLKNVENFGPVSSAQEKATLMAKSDILALPTRYPPEGQPIVILEAMMSGLPVIATDQGGIPDTVIDGVTGYIIPQDAEELLRASVSLAQDRGTWERMSTDAAIVARERYSAESHSDAILELVQRTCHR